MDSLGDKIREFCHFIFNLFVCLNARIQEGKHSQEIAQFQTELAEARTQLQLLQKQLDEQMNQQPTGSQEVTARSLLLCLFRQKLYFFINVILKDGRNSLELFYSIRHYFKTVLVMCCLLLDGRSQMGIGSERTRNSVPEAAT